MADKITHKTGRVEEITQQTHNRFLNLYEFEAERRNGKVAPYFVASRAEEADRLRAVTRRPADGVAICSVYGEKKDRIVLVRQFRVPINDYIYEFPAGLVEPGETIEQSGVREIYEETGLTFSPKKVDPRYCRPFYTTVGMTDESCSTIYGYCSGTPSNAHEEESEDIQIVLADRAECRRILKEENVAVMCAYMLMHFIASQGDPLAFLDEGGLETGKSAARGQVSE